MFVLLTVDVAPVTDKLPTMLTSEFSVRDDANKPPVSVVFAIFAPVIVLSVI